MEGRRHRQEQRSLRYFRPCGTRGKVDIVTDHDAATWTLPRLLQGKGLKKNTKNRDVWDCIAEVLQEPEGQRQVGIRWVPSHQTEKDVEDGRITQADMQGNAAADKLASEAAQINEVEAVEKTTYLIADRQTIILQWMLMSIY